MRKTMIAAVLLAALPAWAHHDEPHPTVLAQAVSPGVDPTVREIRRARENPGATPWVPEQNRNASGADAAGIDDVAGLLYAAQTALRTNRRGQAVEFMERAESRMLTRSTPAPQADQPMAGGPVGRIAAARAAAIAGDAPKAQAELEAALEALNRPRRRR